MNYVKVMNHVGRFVKWLIEDETENTYEISHVGLITLIYKKKCFIYDDELLSSETRISESLETSGDKTTGSEQCSVCGRTVHNYNKLLVLEDTDEYVCIKCSKNLDKRLKRAKNL